MSQSRSEETRIFTFVDYDFQKRGVTEAARAHLMKDRVRSKREARSEWASRNQFSPLRWMQPKAEPGESPDLGKPAVNLASSNESGRRAQDPLPPSFAVIDFRGDCRTVQTTSEAKTHSPGPSRNCAPTGSAPKFGHKKHAPEFVTVTRSSSEPVEPPGERKRIRQAGLQLSPGRLSASMQKVDLESQNKLTDLGLPESGPTFRFESEFGLGVLEKQVFARASPGNTTNPQISEKDHIQLRADEVLAELQEAMEYLPVNLLPSDRALVRYFAVKADEMLGFDKCPEIAGNFDPLLDLIVPFASSSQWCFDTMILLSSACHGQHRRPANEQFTWYTERQYLAARQNMILAQTRSRISALANRGESTDTDVIAFLFLALCEYRFNDREIGKMHFQAWRGYCEMRQRSFLQPCSLECKIIVWWCLSMLVGDEVELSTILDPSMRKKIRDNPTKLFQYFVDISTTSTGEERR